MTSNELTQDIKKYLEVNGHYVSRLQSQGQYRPGGFTKSTVKRGIGDLLAIVCGRAVMIEIKNPDTKDRQSKWQLQTQREVTDSGGVYYVATSLEGFKSFYVSLVTDAV